MTTHTPGPWTQDDRFNGSIFIRGGSSYGTEICCLWKQSLDQVEEQNANARLIAAAPDLMAELKRIAGYEYRADRRNRGMVDISELENLKRIARAAIAKATESDDEPNNPDIDRHGFDHSADAEGQRVDDAYERHVQAQMRDDHSDEPDRAGYPDMDSAGGDDSLNQAYRLK